MSDLERLEVCEVCGMIATDQVIMPDGRMRYFCLGHLPAGVRSATDAEATAGRGRLRGIDELDALRSDNAQLRAALAAATQRAEAAEAKLAAVPVRELRDLMDAIADIRGFPFGFWNEREKIIRWLGQQSEVQP